MRYAILDGELVVNVILALPGFAAQIGAVAIPDDFGIGDSLVGEEWVKAVEPEPEPDLPVEIEPVRVACVLRVPVVDSEVQQLGGPFRIIGMTLLDVGTFLAIFSQNLGPDEPFVVPNNGVSISIAEWGEDYAVIEIREHADGPLNTPASFGFSLYRL